MKAVKTAKQSPGKQNRTKMQSKGYIICVFLRAYAKISDVFLTKNSKSAKIKSGGRVAFFAVLRQ
jgi:hypothetical protein